MSVADEHKSWLDLIHAALARGMTKQAIADVVGVNRSYISQAVHGTGELGKGTASAKHLAKRVCNTLGVFTCPFLTDESGQEVRISGVVCRGYAHREMPTANPREIRHWRACQGCQKKQTSALPPHKVNLVSKKSVINKQLIVMMGATGKASGGVEAETEGWDSIGGPMDNPYSIEDSRHDYWALGYKRRREFDQKQNTRWRTKEAVPTQQAGIIDKVTLPLPEVGAPQIEEITKEKI
ncbi:hypothetical protein BH11PSE12_BH11PSE12_18430 [soil metagenome]